MSVTIRRGEVLAIVGANGSGRSTLAKLLAGLYASAQDSVMRDEVGLATADPEQLWSWLAMLSQDTARWQVTARENVTLGHGDGDDRAVLCDAKAWGADEAIALRCFRFCPPGGKAARRLSRSRVRRAISASMAVRRRSMTSRAGSDGSRPAQSFSGILASCGSRPAT
ncbi:ATP-binding cassette domain-containing protein [Streptomyces sp. MnatMP-M27]|uniref:ATP-binding cassette domain-containing protein n=1 Tax=Streptomyces sp. MnatMP-M27 TaxID=1839768 RepID=UPI00351EEA69